jgi:alpha-beta hydrolase superfamily lysophospholipase
MVILAAFFSALVLVGNIVVQPFQTSVAPPPAELGAKSVVFSSASGATLHGWLAAGTPGNGVVVLLHGIRANRHAMLERALVLHRNGFGVLLFGTADAYTTIAEAKALFDRALAPKQFWPVDGAAHVDFERYNPAEYWARVLPFLITNLRRS